MNKVNIFVCDRGYYSDFFNLMGIIFQVNQFKKVIRFFEETDTNFLNGRFCQLAVSLFSKFSHVS